MLNVNFELNVKVDVNTFSREQEAARDAVNRATGLSNMAACARWRHDGTCNVIGYNPCSLLSGSKTTNMNHFLGDSEWAESRQLRCVRTANHISEEFETPEDCASLQLVS